MKLHQMMCLAVTLLSSVIFCSQARAEQEPIRWYEVDNQKNLKIYLYFFYSESCPHCLAAKPFVDDIEKKYTWLKVERYELSTYPQNLDHYRYMASTLGRVAGQYPAFFFCKQLEMGYVSLEQTGRRVENALVTCHDHLEKQLKKLPTPGKDKMKAQRNAGAGQLLGLALMLQPAPVLDNQEIPLEFPKPETKVALPWLGEMDQADVSLPVLTLVIAGCDAFNPCAFFVLLFLLSLMVHARSRWRMAAVGGIFVLASALVYFAFMAAWLNLFFVMGHLKTITLLAGILSVVIALVNIKDFFWFKKGVSLTIPDEVKPGLFQRMTRLVSEQKLLTMISGTIVLAGLVNLYELLCTSGFPMVYTRILTLRDLPVSTYYIYLAAYNLIYVIPLALIVLGFTFTLGSRKLTEEQGRVLKLLSGMLMLLLGLELVFAPALLSSVSGAIGMLALAVVTTVAITTLRRRTMASSCA